MPYRVEPARLDQVELVQEIINQHELAVDPSTTPIGLEDSSELVTGFFDPAITGFLVDEESGLAQAFFSVNPDANRKRIFTDVYARPGSGLIEAAVRESLRAALELPDGFENWFGVVSSDLEMKSVLESFGMQILRNYWTMRKDLGAQKNYEIQSELAEIRKLNEETEMETWWQLHQDSFSEHFGFAPREFEKWRRIVLDSSTRDPEGVYLLFFDNQPAGFIEMGSSNYHLNGGWVDSIGVAKAFQGRGFGELLLRFGVNYSLDQGRDFVELNVDTGNSTGALRLYEKLGFVAKNSWQQYENKDWARIAREL